MFRVARLLKALLAFTLLAANSASAITIVSAEKPASGSFGVFEHRVGLDALASSDRVDEKLSLRYDFASDFPVAARGTAQATEAFHYTFAKYLRSIQTNGLRQGTYATRSGTLSPLQAQIELALPANRGLPNALVRIDLAGMRQAGYEIPGLTRVSGRFGLPGGGYEMQFPYPIPPQFISVVP